MSNKNGPNRSKRDAEKQIDKKEHRITSEQIHVLPGNNSSVITLFI